MPARSVKVYPISEFSRPFLHYRSPINWATTSLLIAEAPTHKAGMNPATTLIVDLCITTVGAGLVPGHIVFSAMKEGIPSCLEGEIASSR